MGSNDGIDRSLARAPSLGGDGHRGRPVGDVGGDRPGRDADGRAGPRRRPARGLRTQATRRGAHHRPLREHGRDLSGPSDGHVRLYWAKQAADDLVDSLDATGGVGGGSNLHHVGLSKFGNDSASVDLALGTSSAGTVKSPHRRTHLGRQHAAPPGHGRRRRRHGPPTARTSRSGLPVKQVIILLSDGRPNPDNTGPSGSRPTSDQHRRLPGLGRRRLLDRRRRGWDRPQPGRPRADAVAGQAEPGAYRHVSDGDDLPSLFSDIFEEIACTPGIKIVKSADPDTLPAGGGEVTYTFKVTNVGNVALTNVDVTDKPSCGAIDLVSGDEDDDNKLDLDETWIFKCTTTVTESVTDTGTATGHDGNTEVKDTSQAHVDVADRRPRPRPRLRRRPRRRRRNRPRPRRPTRPSRRAASRPRPARRG